MNSFVRGLVAAMSIAFALVNGCSSRVAIEPDSETNWLSPCASDVDCNDRTACVCELCTTTCADDLDCASAPAGATCTSLPNMAGCSAAPLRGRCTVTPEPKEMIENPTGSCTAQSSGARRGLPLPGEGDVWLPDCDRGGLREYWRVFRRPSGTAYVVPNPTLPPQYYVSACADLGNPLFEIVSRYSFCNDLTLPETQNRVASMTPADAMTVAREYHRLLSFGFYSPGILPEPVLGDVLDACELGTSEDSPEFQSVTCEHARAVSRGGGADAGAIPTQDWIGQGGADLAFHLNKLYGIDSQRMTLSIAPELCGLPADPASCTAPGPRYFYDLQIAACAVRPFGSCGSGIADFATEDACRGACALRAHRCMRCDSGGLCGQHDDCGACPLTKPDSGIPCGEIGLRCDYGLTCGAECTCQTDGTWSCVFLLC